MRGVSSKRRNAKLRKPKRPGASTEGKTSSAPYVRVPVPRVHVPQLVDPPSVLGTAHPVRSNVAIDLPADQRISDEDILNNINTFMFAGSDTSSLSLTWVLYLLSVYPEVHTRLRTELLTILPAVPLSSLPQDEAASLYAKVAELPYLENVLRETLRLIPPVHSSIRVATQDDVVPTATPVKMSTPDGGSVEEDSFVMPKGCCVHVPIEAFNLDRAVWGPDGWQFKCVNFF